MLERIEVNHAPSGMIGVESREAGPRRACQGGEMKLTSVSTHSRTLESSSGEPV